MRSGRLAPWSSVDRVQKHATYGRATEPAPFPGSHTAVLTRASARIRGVQRLPTRRAAPHPYVNG